MGIVEAKPRAALDLFQAVCDAAGVPAGATRLDLFLTLPESQQEQIWQDLANVGEEASGP